MTWTAPYYGVQHLNAQLPRGVQITVMDYGTFATCWVKPPTGFGGDEPSFRTAALARAYGEERARLVYGLG
jgi:hypothetical protein